MTNAAGPGPFRGSGIPHCDTPVPEVKPPHPAGRGPIGAVGAREWRDRCRVRRLGGCGPDRTSAQAEEWQGMAVVPLKFRCYQCNGLLGVSRSKVGAVVSCPKCGAELIVPEPVDAEGAEAVPSPASVG